MTNGQKRHLLLGNGFSISLFPKIFNYKSLFENTDFSNFEETRRVFELLETTDFEEVIHALKTTSIVIPAFTKNDILSRAMDSHINQIKRLLIQAIANNHPKNPSEISEQQFNSCRKFLSNFISNNLSRNLVGNVYTVSYDLLLYWTIMHNNELEKGIDELILTADDGFRSPEEEVSAEYVTWGGLSDNQNIRFVHGGLHLFDDGFDLKKFCWERSGGVPLIAQIETALNNDQYPLFVSEGTSIEKLKKIRHSHISLQSALKSFSKISGNLFIYGHSLADNDNHIIDLIPRGKLSHVFIGIYGDPNENRNKLLIRKALELPTKRKGKNTLTITFYHSESAYVWDRGWDQTS
jgi:hypothetical protein